jgi:predicted RNA-binding Zn ribbon-like protein
LVQWTNSANGGVFGGGSSFSAIYHTDFDVFDPAHFPNLENDLRLEALSVLRTDRAAALPIDFGGIASWLGNAMSSDAGKVQGVDFAGAQAALGRFTNAWTRVDRQRASLRTSADAAPLNLALMSTRTDLVPWLISRSGGGVRTTSLATQLQTLASAHALAQKGDAAATLQALERIAGAAPRVSRAAYTEQRLFAYTSGDWSQQFAHRARPLPVTIYDIVHRLGSGGNAVDEAAEISVLESEARANLVDALFLIAGKLDQATRALETIGSR